ncbi:MAG: hypothetical protein E7178_05800 [Erysipelotrichaceae bacterium]|nr:hypothetical protein [Erysipelotrichaceae bacterium]
MDWSQRKRTVLMIVFGILCLALLATSIVMFVLFPDKVIIGLLVLLGSSIFLFLSLFNMPIKEKRPRYRN